MEQNYQYNLFKTWETAAFQSLNNHKNSNFVFPLLKNEQFIALMDQAPSVVFIINHAKSSYEFFSKNVFSVLGFTPEEMCNGGVEFGVSLLEESHSKLYSEQVIPLLYKQFQYYADLNELKKVRMSYTFKSKRKDGTYIWQLHQMTVLETDENGGVLLSMVFLTDINHIKKDDQIDFSVSRLDNSGIYKVEYVASFSKEAATVSLSKRELEIVTLIGKGFSSKEIAQKLFISSHTVSTHRKNILTKFKIKDEIGLINILKTKGVFEYASLQ